MTPAGRKYILVNCWWRSKAYKGWLSFAWTGKPENYPLHSTSVSFSSFAYLSLPENEARRCTGLDISASRCIEHTRYFPDLKCTHTQKTLNGDNWKIFTISKIVPPPSLLPYQDIPIKGKQVTFCNLDLANMKKINIWHLVIHFFHHICDIQIYFYSKYNNKKRSSRWVLPKLLTELLRKHRTKGKQEGTS